MRNHRIPARAWIAIAAVAIVAGHVFALGALSRVGLPAAVIAGLLGLIVFKHLWSRLRR